MVGEPRPKFGKLQGRGAIKGLKADSYVKQPAGSESGRVCDLRGVEHCQN